MSKGEEAGPEAFIDRRKAALERYPLFCENQSANLKAIYFALFLSYANMKTDGYTEQG